MAGERITIDISILQGIFGDLTKLQQQLVGVSGGAVALDNASTAAFADMQQNLRRVAGAVGGVENAFDAGMRNVVSDIMAPLAKTQELEGKLRDLGERVRTSRSVGEIVKLKKEIAATQKELNGVDPSAMERKVGGAASRMRSMFGGLVAPVAGAFAVGGITSFIGGVVRAAGAQQQFTTTMNNMLGSKERADALIADVKKYAAATPFSTEEVQKSATQMLGMNFAAEEVIPTLRKLGDVAAGLGQPVGELTYLYSTARTQGRLVTNDLMQFANRGIPIIDELSKVLGVSNAKVKELTEKGAVKFEHLEQVLNNLTGEGSKFGGLTDAMGRTITGQLDQMSEAWTNFMADIGLAFAPFITAMIQRASSAMDGLRLAFEWVRTNGDTILSVLKGIGIAVGIYTAALVVNNASLIANNALQAIAAIRIGAMAVVMNLVTAATSLWTGAQWLLNVALNANPIGVVVMAITALIAGIVIAYNSSERFRSIVHGVWSVLKATWEWAAGYVRPVIDGIVFGLKLWWQSLVQGAQDVAAFFTGLWSWIVGIKDRAVEAFGGLLDVILAPFRAALDALSMLPGVDKLIGKVKEIGGKVGAAFAEGQAAALVPAAAPGLSGPAVMGAGQNMGASSLVGGAPQAKAKGDGVTVGGSGGSGRTITMNITMNNAFNLPKDANMGARETAQRVVGDIFNKLNDGQFALG